jgi:hypothetical protein
MYQLTMKRISSSHLAPFFGLLLCLSACFHEDDTEIPTPITGDYTWALAGQGQLENTHFLDFNFGKNGSWVISGFQFDDDAGNGGIGDETPVVMAGSRSGFPAWFHSLRKGSNLIWPTSIDLCKDGRTFFTGGVAATYAEALTMTSEILVHLETDGESPWGIEANDSQHTIDLTAGRGVSNGCFIVGTNYDADVDKYYSYLMGVTAGGEIDWGRESVFDIAQEKITVLRSFDDGSCLIAGNQVDSFGGTGAFASRIGSDGTEMWWSYVDSEDNSVLLDAQPTPGGGAILILGDGINSFIVARLSPLGNMTFAKRVAHPLGDGLILYQPTSADGQTICVASTSDGVGGQDPVIFALDGNGEKSWAWQIAAGQDLFLYGLEPSTLGFYMAGVTFETDFVLATTTDAVMLEITSEGKLGNEDCLIPVEISLSVFPFHADSASDAWEATTIVGEDMEEFFNRIEIKSIFPSSALKQAICESAGS